MRYNLPMRLRDYLHSKGLTVTEFAAQIGVSHAAVVRYVHGQRRPEWSVMARIAKVTNNRVRPNDFAPREPAEPTDAAE